MSNEILQPNRLPKSDDALNFAPASPSRPRRNKRASRSRFPETFSSSSSYDRSEPRGYSLMRTRRLIMAALRVWELKNGIHNPWA